MLAETNERQKQTIEYLTGLNQLIRTREQLIGAMQNEVHIISLSIDQESDIISALGKDLDALKIEYGRLLYFMYKNRNSYDMVSFVFASQSFNEAMKRIKFIRFYTEYRKKQMDLILKTELSLGRKVTDLKEKQLAKELVLSQLGDQKKALEEDKQGQSQLMAKLGQDEQRLRKELEEKKRIARKLDKAITDIINREMLASRKKTGAPTRKNESVTPEISKLTNEFAGNRSRLPWPVERGFIAERFGQHEHPTLKNIIVNNNGIKIRTAAGTNVRAIFHGEVRAVIQINGANNSVMVKHGNYFTIYTNLDKVYVKSGDKVDTRQLIGTAASDDNGEAEIGLQVWEGNHKLNPEGWIARQ